MLCCLAYGDQLADDWMIDDDDKDDDDGNDDPPPPSDRSVGDDTRSTIREHIRTGIGVLLLKERGNM